MSSHRHQLIITLFCILTIPQVATVLVSDVAPMFKLIVTTAALFCGVIGVAIAYRLLRRAEYF